MPEIEDETQAPSVRLTWISPVYGFAHPDIKDLKTRLNGQIA